MPMLKIMMRTDLLLKEIDEVFPVMLMPASAELTDHQEDCESCDDVRHYLNAYRDIEVDKTLIRFLRQNLLGGCTGGDIFFGLQSWLRSSI
jgi:hypothetical protein